ncbi:uncharacterized protein LOC106152341 [Lingula anatina]|uniref:Uncharacterized protein LOC106152341 n=1 Tax=Lingula anatina TaxID=7574 RepID=A0A1S3H783_LINAN|nr:uncharacterized protein LOC106152341 [Lingula anatina]|eukprot:XP_013381341.1 uncharacterized protein LOC106152341 [Lingula anatina]
MKFQLKTLLLLAIFLVLLSVSEAAQCSNPVDYVLIAPENYDRNFSSLTKEGGRPLGFNASTWYYEQDIQNPCVKLSNTQNVEIQILIETNPPARICVRDQAGTSTCGQGTVTKCPHASIANNMYFEFYCNAQCEEGDVNFWYRLAMSAPNEENWCFNQRSEFPSDLAPINPIVVDVKTTPKPNRADGLLTRTSPILHLISALVCIFVLEKMSFCN